MGLIFTNWNGKPSTTEQIDTLFEQVNAAGDAIAVLFSGEYTSVFDLGDFPAPSAFSYFDTTNYTLAELMEEMDVEEAKDLEGALEWQDRLIGAGAEAEDDEDFQRNLDAMLD